MIDFRDSPEQAAFRAELRAWLAETLPTFDLPDEVNARDRAEADWHRVLYRGGWMGLSWPVEYGGKGLEPIYEAILNDELGAAGAPHAPSIGFLGRAILLFGSEEQKRTYLPGLLSGEVQWCQGFSEPGAGSDLAALRTQAVRRGDRYVVSGQKVWTSRAAWSGWCLLLARTDPDAPKHKGITCLVVRTDSPGVEVRPIKQITGSLRFAEVFFDDVEVPVGQRIGEEGQGWTLAMTTVGYERGPADIGFVSRYARNLRRLEAATTTGTVVPGDAQLAVGRSYVDIEVLRLRVLASLANRSRRGGPGADSSVDKLLMVRTEQRLASAAMQLIGPAMQSGREPEWLFDYLWSRAASIYGGTEQIQKNIIATRVLGLPR